LLEDVSLSRSHCALSSRERILFRYCAVRELTKAHILSVLISLGGVEARVTRARWVGMVFEATNFADPICEFGLGTF
jgi:hypothetical protein